MKQDRRGVFRLFAFSCSVMTVRKFNKNSMTKDRYMLLYIYYTLKSFINVYFNSACMHESLFHRVLSKHFYQLWPYLISTTTAMMTTITITRKAPTPAPTSVTGNSVWDADRFLTSSTVHKMVFHFYLFRKMNDDEISCSES